MRKEHLQIGLWRSRADVLHNNGTSYGSTSVARRIVNRFEAIRHALDSSHFDSFLVFRPAAAFALPVANRCQAVACHAGLHLGPSMLRPPGPSFLPETVFGFISFG